jgi:predicted enzyme related to lactoylglutathione lyase
VSETRPVLVALRVRDLAESARFYHDALGLQVAYAGGGLLEERHAVCSWPDGLRLLLFEAPPGEQTERLQLGFAVAHLPSAHDRAAATGATVLHPPRDEPQGSTARYADPDGNVVSLTEG